MDEIKNENQVSSEEIVSVAAEDISVGAASESFGYKKKYVLTEDQKKKEGVSVASIIGKFMLYLFLVIFAIWTLFPLLIALMESSLTKSNYNNTSIKLAKLFPISRTKYDLFANYRNVFFDNSSKKAYLTEFDNFTQFPRVPFAFVFTVILVLPTTILGLFTSAMSAFAFSKLTFKGKNWMFGLLLSTMMLPGALSLAPSFSLYRIILKEGTLWMAFPLFVPGMFGAATAVFFLKQYFTGIPSDLIEAGKLDGMGYYKMFFKIVVPLSSAALIAQGILGFVGGYNDYFGPKLYLQGAATSFETVQLVLVEIKGKAGDDIPKVFAACMVALLPTLILYFYAQRFFVEGIATSGMKI